MTTRESHLVENRQRIPFTLDGGVAARAAIGLIVLATDHTIEHEWRQIVPRIPGVGVFATRIWNDATINEATLAAMQAGIADATRLIRPGERIDVVGYACTSGAMVIGPDVVRARVAEHRPQIPVTNPISAASAGLRAMGVKRVALLTPYIDDVNQRMRRYLEQDGFAVPVMGSFNHENDNEVARISEQSIRAALIDLASHPAVDGAFVACTSLRLCGIVADTEAQLGKPATSSNHALLWHCLRLAGVTDSIDGFGRLYQTPLPLDHAAHAVAS
jgi:maleate isomerase